MARSSPQMMFSPGPLIVQSRNRPVAHFNRTYWREKIFVEHVKEFGQFFLVADCKSNRLRAEIMVERFREVIIQRVAIIRNVPHNLRILSAC